MLNWLRRERPVVAAAAALPAGLRVYAIGDIHGRADLLDALLERARTDHAARAPADAAVILLGDLVDRGPASAEVIARARAGLDWAALTTLKGNHEAIMVDAVRGDRRLMANWLEFGGLATLRSFGVAEAVLRDGDIADLLAAADRAIPRPVLNWLAALPTHRTLGGYHFVHAGVRPGVALDAQTDEDRIWIRGAFLESRAQFGATVVHGHTQVPEVDWRSNRIAIDTGAYHSDRLTALALEGAERRVLQT